MKHLPPYAVTYTRKRLNCQESHSVSSAPATGPGPTAPRYRPACGLVGNFALGNTSARTIKCNHTTWSLGGTPLNRPFDIGLSRTPAPAFQGMGRPRGRKAWPIRSTRSLCHLILRCEGEYADVRVPSLRRILSRIESCGTARPLSTGFGSKRPTDRQVPNTPGRPIGRRIKRAQRRGDTGPGALNCGRHVPAAPSPTFSVFRQP